MTSSVTLAKYSVRPFSGPKFAQNEQRVTGLNYPCAICGKEVKKPQHMAVIIDGGADWGDEDSDTHDPGFMGCYPIGNDCHRKYEVR